MNICGLCQQICNNLTKIYSNRFKTLAQIILRLKGFKESQEINSVLIICDNCKQGIESVAKFWEHIPEAKQENLSNNTSNLQEIYDTSPNSNYQDEMVTYSTQNLPAIKLDEKNNDKKEIIKKPIKLKMRKKRKESNSYAVVSSTTAEECSIKRHRQPPKRYSDYDIELTSYPDRVSRNHIKIKENRMSPRKSLFNKLPVALIRSKSGVTLGHLIEIENKTQTSRMRMICVTCLNVFSYEKEFHKHLEIHKTKGLLGGGEAIDCNDFLYSCKLCEKSFKEHYAVRRHYKFVHSEERPLKCEHCSASFKYKFNLDYHMAKHIPKRRFECSHCKKAFVMRYELQIHLRTHTKEKPYKCEFCTYAFAHRSNLKAHQKLKHLRNSSGLDAPINEVNYCIDNNLDSIENTKQLEKANHIPANDEINNNNSSSSSLMIESKSEEISLTDLNCNDDSINCSVEKSMGKESVLRESIDNEKRTNFLQIEYKPNETNNTSNQMPLREENKMLIRSNSNNAGNFLYDYRKQFSSSAASMYSFKIPNTTLRIISQSPLLTMKKWPKSYQRAITETPHTTTFESTSTIKEQKSSNLKKENSENKNELHSKDTELKSIRPAISECQKSNAVESKTNTTNELNLETETCNNFQTVLIDDNSRTIFSDISNNLDEIADNGFTGTKKSSVIDDIQSDKEFVSSNTSCNKNVSENIVIKCGFVPNDTSTPSKTNAFSNVTKLTKPNSPAKVCRNPTKTEKIMNVGKFSKFSPIILDPQNLKNIQIIKVTSKNDSSNISANNIIKVSNTSDIKPGVKSPVKDVFKVSSKPVKIIKLNKSKNSNAILGSSQEFNLLKSKTLTSSSIRKSPTKDNIRSHNLSDRIIRIVKKNSTQSLQSQQINNFDLNATPKIESIVNNFSDKTSKSNGLTKGNSTQSLLKPNIKAQQTCTFDLNTTTKTNGLTIQFCDKPLITKVEILPPLTSLPTLEKTLASSATPQIHVQPLKEYKYQCPYCWKYFKQKSPLTKHIRTHTGEKPYKCNLCPKSYADASNFKKHKILHKNAAEALNISNTSTTYPVQSSPAHSTVSDPDPDGIEVMQTIKKYNCSLLDKNNDIYDDDTASLTSSTMESYMWEDALDHALSNDEIQESIKRNLASFNNAIMPNNVEDISKKKKISMNRQTSCEDPD